MNPLDYYLNAIKNKYADFSGRARRSEFWYFALFNVAASFIAGLIDSIIGQPILGLLYTLAVLIPGIAVSVRRLHDTGRSGWWLLLALLPILGAIALIVFYCQDSEPGLNQYGPNPKETVTEEDDYSRHLVE